MPRVKPAVITIRDGTILRENVDKIEYGPQLITTYATEIQSHPVERKGPWWQWNIKRTVQEQQKIGRASCRERV